MLGRVSLCFTVIVPEMFAAERHTEDVIAAATIGNNTRNAARRRKIRGGAVNPTLCVIGTKLENSRLDGGIFRFPSTGHTNGGLKRTTPTVTAN